MTVYKHLIYKEWIKTRWFALIAVMLSVGVVCSIFFTVRGDFAAGGGVSYLSMLLTYKIEFFSAWHYVPLVTALMIGLSQFVPEVTDKRIKLSFHLPVRSLSVIYTMVTYGFMLQLAISALSLGIYALSVSIYLPAEIVRPSIVTMLPWCLGGLTAYFMIAMTALEPLWKFRILYILVGCKIVSLFFTRYGIGNAATILPLLCIITLTVSLAPVYTSYRFKKGIF